MTQEEKAKSYDEAIKRLEDIETGKCQKTFMFTEGLFDYIFPELKESEDERIRKEIIAHIKWCEDSGYCAKEEMTRWITWFEKQGKPIDKIVKRAMTEKQRVLLTETNGDANIDWDTRSLKDAITLLKHGLNYLQEIEVKKQTMPSSRFGGCSEYIPTRFDKEKQCKQGEQKSNPCDGCVNRKGCINCENGELRETEQKPWSEEDEKMLKTAITSCEQCGNEYAYYWLKSLRDRVQPKQEWSEEDDRMCKAIIDNIKAICEEGYFVGDIGSDKLINWLNSLRFQKQWKPSDEQMRALSDINLTGGISYAGQGQELINLYNDLKKLKG